MRQIIDGKYAIDFTKPSSPGASRKLSLQQVVVTHGDAMNPSFDVMAIYGSETMLIVDLIRHHMGASIFRGNLKRDQLNAEFIRLSELCDVALVHLFAGSHESA